MKNLLKLFSGIIILAFLFAACTDQEEEVTMQSVGLEQQGGSALKGKKKVGSYLISYEVKEVSELYFETNIKIDKCVLTAFVDYTKEDITLDGYNAILTEDQKEALLALGEELSEYLFKDESVDNFMMTEYTLLRLLEYWAKSPANYKYQKNQILTNRDTGIKGTNEGITCIRKNTYVTAVYDDAGGKEYRDRKLVNGNRCLGRCGSGCPGIFTLASAWTKDCLDHDQCGRVLGGSTNPFDSNCGDEYAQAADDYLFGVIRGCRG